MMIAVKSNTAARSLARSQRLHEVRDDRHRDIHLLLAHDQRRQQSNHVPRARGQQQQPPVSRLTHQRTRGDVQLHAHEQPAPSHLLHAIAPLQLRAQTGPQLLAAFHDVLHEPRRVDAVEHRVGRAAHERPARERAPVVPRSDRVRHRLRRQHRADGQPARERLRDGHDVRRDAHGLVTPQVPGASEAALDFVENEERAGVVADFF
eukprot:31529-Pelagococcus_subviridis.AAC.10